MKIHAITIKREGSRYRLLDNGNHCGPRLEKGSGKGAAWPFIGEVQWWIRSTKKAAEIAAAELQAYLDAREEQLGHMKEAV